MKRKKYKGDELFEELSFEGVVGGENN